MKRLHVIFALFALFVFLLPAHLTAQEGPGTIVTFAGTGTWGFSGDEGPAVQAQLNNPVGVAVDAKGNVYIADQYNNRIRRVGTDGTITSFAELNFPAGVAVDAAGNVYIADKRNNRIHRMGLDGIVTIFAGTGRFGFSGDGGPAAQATLNFPSGVAVDAKGNVYIADTQNNRIRRVGPDGLITTFAGTGSPPFSGDGGPAAQATLNFPSGVAVDAKGNVYIADSNNHRIRRVGSDGIITTFAGGGRSLGDGGPATQASLSPSGVAMDTNGNLYIADTDNHRIRRVGPDGIIITFAGTGTPGFSGDGGPAAQASLNRPSGVAVDAKGNVYIADPGNNRIRRVDSDGIITTFAGGSAGDGRPAAQASLFVPISVAVDANGAVYIADEGDHRIRRVGPDGIITTLAGDGKPPADSIGDGGPAAQAKLVSPQGVTVDIKGNVYIASGGRIRRVGPDGIITTLAGDGKPPAGSVRDGGPATQARLISPTDVAVDAQGFIYIADRRDHRMRRVRPDGIITTFAGVGPVELPPGNFWGPGGFSGDGGPAIQAHLNNPVGVAVDAKGNVYIADSFNHRIRRVGSDGAITTFAGSGPTGYQGGGFSGDGGPATQARLNEPRGVAVDAKGNVYIADLGNNRIRRVGTDGIMTTFVGTGFPGFSGDGGPATQARLSRPSDVAVDAKGNVYIADSGNRRIRRLTGVSGPSTGPSISLSASSLRFDNTNVGSTSQNTLTISNTGTGSLAVTRITVNGPDASQFKASPTTATVAAGGSQTVMVMFTPTSAGPKTATLSVAHNAPGSPSTIALSGIGYDTVQVSPPTEPDLFKSKEAFEATINRVGTAKDTAFSGAYSVIFKDIRFTKDCKVDFVRRHDFFVNTGAPDSALQRVLDQGYPDFPATIRLTQNSGRIVLDSDGDGIESPLNGWVDMDGAFQAVWGTYENNHNFMVAAHSGKIQGADIQGEFTTQFKLLSFSEAPGSCSFTAKFAGSKTRPAGSEGPSITLSASSLVFDITRVGSTSQKTLTIYNTGGAALQVRIAVEGSDTSQFRIYPLGYPVGATIAAGKSYTVTVMFNPTSVGTKSAVLVVVHNAPGSPARVALSGIALPADQSGPIITTFAGSGVHGFSGDGGPATRAGLNYPSGVAVDTATGAVYIADRGNFRVRRVGADGVITTFAGSGSPRFEDRNVSGDGGPAAQAKLAALQGLAVDVRGNVYLADQGNHRIRRVSPDGVITTVAGTGLLGDVGGYSGDGGPAAQASLNNPVGLAVDVRGNVYIADQGNHRIRRVSPDGMITTVAGTGIRGYSGDEGPATQASLSLPYGVAVNAKGDVYIADLDNHRIRRVRPDGITTTFAGTGTSGFSGDGGPATRARLNGPRDVAADARGNVYIAEGGRIRRVGIDSIITTFAGTGEIGFSGDGGPATQARLSSAGIAVDAKGNVYIVDTFSHRVRRVEVGSLTGVSGLASDFDRNGAVDFNDFFAFASAFGQKRTVANAKFDLDQDGEVGFGDFFLFAGEFGKTTKSGKATTLSSTR
jgi:sugar lactone lactonase YvrE